MSEPQRRSTRRLDPEKVVLTLEQLQARIEARFPASGLAEVCADLAMAGRTTELHARRLARPFIALRLFVGLILLAVREIEGLTSDLGRKIWQKITILGELDEHGRD